MGLVKSAALSAIVCPAARVIFVISARATVVAAVTLPFVNVTVPLSMASEISPVAVPSKVIILSVFVTVNVGIATAVIVGTV